MLLLYTAQMLDTLSGGKSPNAAKAKALAKLLRAFEVPIIDGGGFRFIAPVVDGVGRHVEQLYCMPPYTAQAFSPGAVRRAFGDEPKQLGHDVDMMNVQIVLADIWVNLSPELYELYGEFIEPSK